MPSLPVYEPMMPVEVVSPVPVSVMVWLGLAEGSAAFAGVPVIAVALATVSVAVSVNGALVPPAVVTVIGPYDAGFSGTDRLTCVPVLKTSGPMLLLLASVMVVPPN